MGLTKRNPRSVANPYNKGSGEEEAMCLNYGFFSKRNKKGGFIGVQEGN